MPEFSSLSHDNTLQGLLGAISELAHGSVAVLGDVMLDRFIYGSVARISPEAPIPVLRAQRRISMLGGAGNVLRNLSSLGVSAGLVAVIGTDEAGGELSRLVAQEEKTHQCGHLVSVPGRPTTIKERFVAGNQQLLRVDSEDSTPLAQDTRAAVLRGLSDFLTRTCPGAIVLSDYGKGVLDAGTIAQAVELARARGCFILADPKGPDYSLYRGVSLITPNRKELHEAAGLPTTGDNNVVRAAQRLIGQLDIGAVLATRSEDGMTLVTAEGQVRHFGAETREVFDVSGAGDTVIAVVAAALAAGLPLEQGVALANRAAGLVVSKTGTAVTTPDELRQLLGQSLTGRQGSGQISDLSTLLVRVQGWRAAGLVVGVTNGCFDILHPGHLSLLRQARAHCDRLIVALNSDESVRRLKGAQRPIQSQDARAAIVAAHECVDHVVIFDTDTPLDVVVALRPDVLIKGADYSEDEVVGAAEVRATGGRIVLAKIEAGYSTTGTVNKIHAAKGGHPGSEKGKK